TNDLEVARNKAASDVAKAELQHELAKLDVTKYVKGDYEAEVKEKMGEIALARRDLEDARDKLKNYENLVREGFVPKDQLKLKDQEVKQKEFVLESKEKKLWVLEEFTRTRQVTEYTAKAKDAERELERTQKSADASVEKAKSELEAAEVTVKIEKAALA